jgi:hypothetical protein
MTTNQDSSGTPPVPRSVPIWWRAHDVIVGLLAGFGVGVIGGLFATRLIETNVIVAIGGAAGAILGILALTLSRHREGGFVNATVVIAWVLLAGSALFLTALVLAIANFE